MIGERALYGGGSRYARGAGYSISMNVSRPCPCMLVAALSRKVVRSARPMLVE